MSPLRVPHSALHFRGLASATGSPGGDSTEAPSRTDSLKPLRKSAGNAENASSENDFEKKGQKPVLMTPREIPENAPSLDPDFHELVSSLIDTLQEESRQNQRFLTVVRRKKAALGRGAHNELDGIFRTEKEVLADCVTIERERLAISLALGECLGGSGPRRMRLAELMLYASPDDRDELLDLRDDFRDVADELEALSGVESRFARHVSGNMRLYLHDGGFEEPSPGDEYPKRCRPGSPSTLPQHEEG